MLTLRHLVESDAETYAALRRAALLESPLAFGASPETDVACSASGAREQLRGGSLATIIGAFEGAQLAGAIGLLRSRHAKAEHKVHLWGMYVLPQFRRSGIGAELLTAAIAEARAIPHALWLELGVSSAAADARRLYERFGFVLWGTEPDALRHNGQSVDIHHMSLRLR